ncbi:LysR family transcriptional regulator [Collinsella sp. zg1085]|uniref:LysR family transcriptional regulator n=1 Tax=Collinsella sp. zg1085 TaxID=2844380 RepID=UPI001C0B8288|nr:LysR family transcriptional regulator [Collinsella sp. zg1085]QWT17523.1 LysR family transcriptional regulator [Collinsella sp. zg1085]
MKGVSLLDQRVNTFMTVVDSGSFSRAAKTLYITPVSVKKQLDSLEAELGIELLERTNRGVTPTEAGRMYFESARQARSIMDASLQRARFLGGFAARRIRVGTSLLRPASKLLEVWARVGTESDLSIEVVPFDDGTELDDVVKHLGEDIDCIIGPCDAPHWHEACSVLKLGFYDCRVAVPRKRALACKPFLTWDDLCGESIMLVRGGESPVMDSIRAEIEGYHPEVSVVDAPRFYSIETFNYCESRSLLMETLDAWEGVHPGFVTIPMDWGYRVPFGMLYAKRASNAMREFAALVEKAI